MILFRYLLSGLILTSTASSAWANPALSLDEANRIVDGLSGVLKTTVDSAPAVYEFVNSDGVSTVQYPQATFRQVLLNDIKLVAYKLKLGEFKGDANKGFEILNSIFRYQPNQKAIAPYGVAGDQVHGIKVKDTSGNPLDIFEGKKYGKLSYQVDSLSAKMVGALDGDEPVAFLGWNQDTIGGVTIDKNGDGLKSSVEFVDAMMSVMGRAAGGSQSSFSVNNGTLKAQTVVNAAITKEGLDLAQMIQKVLTGSVLFYQNTAQLLNASAGNGEGLLSDNDQAMISDSGVAMPFTALESAWDHAMGNFGGARDYSNYSMGQIADGLSLDTFGEDFDGDEDPFGNFPMVYLGEEDSDGEISLHFEKNFSLSINAAKREKKFKEQVSFTKNIIGSLLKGRQLIADKPAGYLGALEAYGAIVGHEMERVIAATVIHYINDTQEDYSKYGTDGYKFTNLAKHFSEMKGFALGFQWNPGSALPTDKFQKLHLLMKDAPVDPSASTEVAAYLADLDSARALLAKAYQFDKSHGFTPELLKGW